MIIHYIKQWYNGKQVKTFSDDEDDLDGKLRMIIDYTYHREYHWTAMLVRKISSFVAANYKWIIATIIAIVAIVAN